MQYDIFSYWENHMQRDVTDWNDRPLTYKGLLEKVKEVADLFKSMGIRKNDHVAIKMSNSANYLVAFLALWKMDVTIIPIDSQVNYTNMVGILSEADAHYLVTEKKGFDVIDINGKNTLNAYTRGTFVCNGSTMEIVNLNSSNQRETWIKKIGLASCSGYMILFTSGTSGKGKGVLLKKESFINNVFKVINYTGLKDSDSILLTLPLTYCFALSQMLAHIIVGGKIVLDSNVKLNKEILQKIQGNRVTNYAATPYFYETMIKDIDKNGKLLQNNLRFFMSAGGYISQNVIQETLRLFPNVTFYNNYGQTEASPRLCYNKITGFDSDTASVGKPLPGVDIKIFDDAYCEAGKNTIGEIGYMSEDAMIGYYKDKVIDRNTYWMSGDLGYINDEDNLVIVGRKDSMIKLNGRKVYKNVIEDQLNQLDFVRVLKLKKEKHPTFGEYFAAYVVLKENYDVKKCLEDIYTYCKKNFDKYQVPKKVILCDQITLTSNQKVMLV